MAAVFSKTTKLMLKNVIRHTNSHNKTVEEAEMWQQFERRKGMGGLDPSNPSFGHDDRCFGRSDRDKRRNDYWNSRSEKRAYLSTSCRSRRAHMDEEEEKAHGGSSTSTYWMRQLEKLETSDPNRWDHSGYRELYPNDFRSDRSDSSSSAAVSRSGHKKDRTKKKKKQRSRSKKWKPEKSSRLHKKQRRKRRSPSSSDKSASDSLTSGSSPPRRQHGKEQRVSRKRHYNSSTAAHQCASSDSSSGGSSFTSSGSDSYSRERCLPRRQKEMKRTRISSISKKRDLGNSRSSGRCMPSDSSSGSYSESYSDSDSRGRVQSHSVRMRKRTRSSSSSSSVSSLSSDRSVSVCLPEKRVKREKPSPKNRHGSMSGSKQKSRRHGSSTGREKEGGNQLVVSVWREANGHGGSLDSMFYRHPHAETSLQLHGGKRQHEPKRSKQQAKLNGSLALQPKKR